MKIVVIGTGYVGLVQGACLAHLGHDVVGVDIDENRLTAIANGQLPIFEKDLPELVSEGIENGRLKFTSDLGKAVENRPDAVFVCVQTPSTADGSCDLSFVQQVLRQLSNLVTLPTVIVIKSTVPPGTGDQLHEWLGNSEIEIAVNPEFLREGTSVHDFLHPDRIVLGVESSKGEKILREIYRGIEAPVFAMSIASAQLSKYAANCMLALRLSFINEIANVADALGADVRDVTKVVGSDPRLGDKFLRAGAGFGGSCFPKDVLALHQVAAEQGYEAKLVAPIMKVNDEQPARFVKKISERLGGLAGRRLAIWGLAFNRGTDDTRESPAIKIINLLWEQGAEMIVYDPQAMRNAAKEIGDRVSFAQSMIEGLDEVEALLVLTEWPQFAEADWNLVKEKLSSSIIFDGKNFLPHEKIEALGFEVHGIGLCPDTRPRQ